MRIKSGRIRRQEKTSEELGWFGDQKMLDKAENSCLNEDPWEEATCTYA